MTGLTKIPPMGLKDTIKVQFLHSSPLPRAEAFLGIIKLPTVHVEKKTVFLINLIKGFEIALDILDVCRPFNTSHHLEQYQVTT